MNTWRIGGSPAGALADCEAASARPLDPEAADLACIGSLAQMGFKFARFATGDQLPEIHVPAAEQLAWWTARVRAALDRLGSI
jgi:hypothetical protein